MSVMSDDHDLLIRIETKLNNALDQLIDLNKRVRVLETGYWRVVGSVGGIVIVGDLFIKWMLK